MAKKTIRPIRIEGNIAYVLLTKGCEAVIDAEDVPLIAGRNWCACKHRLTIYATATDRSANGVKTCYLHRIILDCHEGLHVDHIDGDGLNNRKSNLRTVTAAENARNQRIRPSNTSGFKGVTWNKDRNKWQAQIMLNRKQMYLGRFSTPEAAHEAYREASKALHGQFGRVI